MRAPAPGSIGEVPYLGAQLPPGGPGGRLGPVAQAELGQQVADVVLHRLAGDEQPLGDLGVGQPGADQLPYTAVGYGLEGSGPRTSFGGDTRRRAELRLVNLNGVLGTGKGVSAKFSSNANTGGTCFGDSGGPIFVDGTTTLVAVVSFGTSSTCSGTSGAYRLDQADDLAFLATFGITP
jgi:hypothetical protein